MNKVIVFIVCLSTMFSCNETKTAFDRDAECNAILALMGEQQTSWNNADLNGFMQHYWQSDSLKFVGSSGITYGWQKTLKNYHKNYPNPEAMGQLQFTNLTVDILDESNAYIIGQWQLFRTSDTLSGHYTLLWKKISGKWVIVADHSS